MKILALPNALKGSLSARQALQIFVDTLAPRHQVRAFSISDGGDGFLDFFKQIDPHAKTLFITAKNAFNENKRAPFLLLADGKTAVIETARICGLGKTPKNKLDPLGATSYGVGQVLSAAVKHGAKIVYVGLGGVACNDGGAGLAVACGARLTDSKNKTIALGAKGLLKLSQLDLTPIQKNFSKIKIIAVTDVSNPLLGPAGSASVFGPQKGASPRQVKILERALTRWERLLKKATGKTTARLPGAGAAGAIATGLYAGFNAQLCPGTTLWTKQLSIKKHLRWADLIITTEGKLDKQTFYGKAPGTVLKLSREYRKPVLFICGQTDSKALYRQPLRPDCLAVLTDFASNTEDAKKQAAKYLRRICRSL
ncbi:MAG: glycerate kinase [Elusimicrobiaceae bacterium]|nr:glycerate kinase [Elusimicrobiaceae bacterium]